MQEADKILTSSSSNLLRISEQQEMRHESSTLFEEMSNFSVWDCTRYEYKQASYVKNESSAMSITFA